MWKHRLRPVFRCRLVVTPSTLRIQSRLTADMPVPPQPDLPHPAHIDKESALGKKFGKETPNYFGSKQITS